VVVTDQRHGTSARWPHQRVRTADSSVALGGWRVAHATYPSVPLTSAAKAEGVRHWVARYLDVRGGVSRNPSPSKTGYKMRYGRWEALWPCFGEPTATAPGVWHTTSRTALLTKRSAVRSTNHLVTKRALGRSEMWPRRQERTPHLTQAHRAVPS
jgi:hypothetical protein